MGENKIRCFEEAKARLEAIDEKGLDIYEFLSCVCEDLVDAAGHDHESDLINRYLDQRFDLENF